MILQLYCNPQYVSEMGWDGMDGSTQCDAILGAGADGLRHTRCKVVIGGPCAGLTGACFSCALATFGLVRILRQVPWILVSCIGLA